MKASDGGWAHGGAAPATHLVADLVLDARDLLDVLLGHSDPSLRAERAGEHCGLGRTTAARMADSNLLSLPDGRLDSMLTTTGDDSGSAAKASGARASARIRQAPHAFIIVSSAIWTRVRSVSTARRVSFQPVLNAEGQDRRNRVTGGQNFPQPFLIMQRKCGCPPERERSCRKPCAELLYGIMTGLVAPGAEGCSN